MDRVLAPAAWMIWLSLPFALARFYRFAQGTSLVLALKWCGALWLFWGGIRATIALTSLPAGAVDVLWYACAIILLVPPIAVLGARRPIHRVWNWFVLIPLVIVFLWPAFISLRDGRLPLTWSVEEPVVAGYVLVLVMGIGNYIGTRLSAPAVLWGLAGSSWVLSLCPTTAPWIPESLAGGDQALLILAAAAWLAVFISRQPSPTEHERPAIDGVWVKFSGAFGVVWARRMQERFNDLARQANSPVRLGSRGLETESPASGFASLPAEQVGAAQKLLRWLLQKFVDAAWIDRELEIGTGDNRDQPATTRRFLQAVRRVP